jgi:serine/threonine-protein kinase RsbT
MTKERRIYVNNDLDVVVARMQAREMAKEIGFGTADQARISLAASELARVLSWNTSYSGEIILESTSRNGQSGIQINCLVTIGATPTPDEADQEANVGRFRSIAGARQLVDESVMEAEGSKYTRVTLLKWLK